MPKLIIKEDHSLGTQIAQERIQQLLSDLKEKFSDKISQVQENWQANNADFSFKLMGFSVKGNLTVSDNTVELQGNLPFAAVPFRGMVETAIREQTRELLNKQA